MDRNIDKQLGEVGLDLRLFYRAFAECEAVDFTSWVHRFDVLPTSLTLDVAISAISALRASHSAPCLVPAGWP